MKNELFYRRDIAGSLDDLTDRLARTRWPSDYANDDWRYGANLVYLKELVEYWHRGYDWRRHEREINRFAHYRPTIDGVPIQSSTKRARDPSQSL